MAMIACPKCNRQIAEESVRCIYCGHRPSATDTERAEDEARIARLSAMYSAGLGLPGQSQRSWIERMRDESMTRKVMTAGLLVPLMMVRPFKTIAWIRELFRP